MHPPTMYFVDLTFRFSEPSGPASTTLVDKQIMA